MKYRIAIEARHYDEVHQRDVEVLDDLDTLITAVPQQGIRVQTLTGEVQYQTPRRTLHTFKLTIRED